MFYMIRSQYFLHDSMGLRFEVSVIFPTYLMDMGSLLGTILGTELNYETIQGSLVSLWTVISSHNFNEGLAAKNQGPFWIPKP